MVQHNGNSAVGFRANILKCKYLVCFSVICFNYNLFIFSFGHLNDRGYPRSVPPNACLYTVILPSLDFFLIFSPIFPLTKLFNDVLIYICYWFLREGKKFKRKSSLVNNISYVHTNLYPIQKK